MRVISGIARNRKLLAPEGMHTRPITDQIKEALFNMWQFNIENADFLDVFAGSGSMGIEAMSRGAAHTVFVDNDKTAISVIKKNIQNCQLTGVSHEVCKEDAFTAIRRLSEAGRRFDIIYLDPPFTVEAIFDPVMEELGSHNLLKDTGKLAIRTLNTKSMKDRYGVLEKVREKKYGLSVVHFYALKEVEEDV